MRRWSLALGLRSEPLSSLVEWAMGF